MSLGSNYVKKKKGFIDGNPVAGGWAGAVIRNSIRIKIGYATT